LIDKIKKHPLTRALRIDKFTAIALESVFHEYIDEERAVRNIPVFKLINRNIQEIKTEAEKLYEKLLESIGQKCLMNVEECQSQIGGGSLPLERITSYSITFKPITMTTSHLEKRLRHIKTPIIGRVVNDLFIIDMRTVLEGEEDQIYETFINIFN
ncbi:MAG: L-seryl-tRNA(Sec) selenium transferase, partial [Sedimentibacter sp.]|nr:L-seryl-tRNA(Sec) selenium transferase [Sedimentibacter sp.]